MKWPSTLLLLLAATVEHVYSHTIEISAGKKECFFEDLHVNDQVRPMLLVRRMARLTFEPALYR